MSHKVEDIIQIFNQTFFDSYQTQLEKGDEEPIYLPASEQCSYHRVIFAHGYYASALHEIAHWLIAGKERRLQEDFGYWYVPDGRNAQQQKAFEQVEIKPQAIEWALCVAANKPFRVSVDNLNGAGGNEEAFHLAVFEQVKQYLNAGFSARTEQLLNALCQFYGTQYPTTTNQFLAVATAPYFNNMAYAQYG